MTPSKDSALISGRITKEFARLVHPPRLAIRCRGGWFELFEGADIVLSATSLDTVSAEWKRLKGVEQ